MPRLVPSVLPSGAIGSQPQPSIPVDEDLSLRPWLKSDAAFVLDAFSNRDIEHWYFRGCGSISEAEEWIAADQAAWVAETCASWAIMLSPQDTPIGSVAVHFSPRRGTGEVTYWVAPAGRRQRAATRATAAATCWAHDVGIQRVRLMHSTQNEISGLVAVGAGFVFEGICRSSTLHDDGWHDMALYSHLTSDSTPTN
ncbi:GNAT family N-acetyltransferase [Actinopolymorpha pittospori]